MHTLGLIAIGVVIGFILSFMMQVLIHGALHDKFIASEEKIHQRLTVFEKKIENTFGSILKRI